MAHHVAVFLPPWVKLAAMLGSSANGGSEVNRTMQTFIDELYAADSEKELKSAMMTAAEGLDLPRFVYL